MPHFPILAHGSVVQYPVVRRTAHPVVQTTSPGGHEQRSLAEWDSEVEWLLSFRELSDEEARAIEALYISTVCGLESFTFIDPLANLLRWSEDYTRSVWIKT